MMNEFTSIYSLDFSINNGCPSSDIEENNSSEEKSSIINYETIKNIFNYPPIKEDTIKASDIYLIPTNISQRQIRNLFTIIESTNHITQMTKKKRGKPSILNTNKTHNKFSIDNLLRKINNHSLSLIVPFLNDILKDLGIKEEFCQLPYDYKKKIKNNYFCDLKKKTLGEIIKNKISSKYKKVENKNIDLYGKIENHEVLKNIFKMDYITFFKRYYMESKKSINLKVFGLEKEINLSEKCKMYNDLIEKIKKSNNKDTEKYIKCIKKCINKNYIECKLFKTIK